VVHALFPDDLQGLTAPEEHMNERNVRDLGETRTRRAMLVTAGGVLLPAGLLAADGEDAEATKQAKRRRRRRRKQVRWVGNDVIINVRNATSERLAFRYSSIWAEAAGHTTLDPGKESGFVTGLKPADLTMKCLVDIRLTNSSGNDERYMIRCINHEFMTPEISISWYPNPHEFESIAALVNMGEDTTFEITHRGYRFHVHRWTNGKEPLDNYDEWYTRFFVTISNV
jgi:hypothetical protein